MKAQGLETVGSTPEAMLSTMQSDSEKWAELIKATGIKFRSEHSPRVGLRRQQGQSSMAEGITGWRLHVGVIFPTPVPPRPIREWYQVVPDGVDITTVSLTIQQLTDDNMEEAIKGVERAAKQLSNFDVDVIFQSGVPPVVATATGLPQRA